MESRILINIHLLKPARLAVDPLYSIPPTIFGTKIHRYILYIVPDIDTIIVLHWHDIVPDIVYNIVYDIILDDIKLMMLLVRDCVCVVAPYPFRIEPLEDFDPIGDLEFWM